ncbi:MAG: metallophosphoesterase family protein [Thalassobaculales bacterium]
MIGRLIAALRRAPRGYALPPRLRVYAVGDVHGRADLLAGLHRRVAADAAGFLSADPSHRVEIVHLGDYIDRGPDPAGVLDLIARPWPDRFSVVNLKGNHEAALLAFLDSPGLETAGWLDFGGLETLIAYGVRPDPALPPEPRLRAIRDGLAAVLAPRHLALLRGLTPWHRVGDYWFVHAGVDPSRPLEAQEEADLLWRRPAAAPPPRAPAGRVVHGHTVTREPEILPHRIGIDLGAYATGRLAAVALEAAAPPRILVEDGGLPVTAPGY